METPICSISLVVKRDLAKVESRVQLSYIAPKCWRALKALGGLKPCMDAMRTLRKRQTRGEAIIRRRGGSLEIQIAKSSVQCSDKVPCNFETKDGCEFWLKNSLW